LANESIINDLIFGLNTSGSK